MGNGRAAQAQDSREAQAAGWKGDAKGLGKGPKEYKADYKAIQLDRHGNKLCFYYKDHRVCPKGKECKYSHDLTGLTLPTATPPPQWVKDKLAAKGNGSGGGPQVRSVILSCASVAAMPGTRDRPLGLLDSGANEVVRPFSLKWWRRIKSGRCKGSVVSVNLAAGLKSSDCALTGSGELMIRGPDNEVQGWIFPCVAL